MSAISIISRIRATGGEVTLANDGIKLKVPASLRDEMVAEIKAQKDAVKRGLKNEADDPWSSWRRFHAERIYARAGTDHYSTEMMERLAWRETLHAWHLEHGQRMPADRCAGCGGRFPGKSLTLPDGALVHAVHGCLIDYGEAWQGRAADALATMGVTAPTHDA